MTSSGFYGQIKTKFKLYWIFNMEGPAVRVVKVETLSFLCSRLGCIERLNNQMKKNI